MPFKSQVSASSAYRLSCSLASGATSTDIFFVCLFLSPTDFKLVFNCESGSLKKKKNPLEMTEIR